MKYARIPKVQYPCCMASTDRMYGPFCLVLMVSMPSFHKETCRKAAFQRKQEALSYFCPETGSVFMQQIPSVAVVILNWNGRSFLEQFLPSVCASTYTSLGIYLADNASTDNSVAFVREHFPQVRILAGETNEGFAGGYNRALQEVEADYYVLLNQDVEVEPGWIEPVIAWMESDRNLAACQPKIRSWKQKDFFEYAGAGGGWIDRYGFTFCRGRIFDDVEPDRGQYDDAQKIFWATGAALFIRSFIFHEAGGFDPFFFAHMEEIDLCWRIQNMGYDIGYCPASCVYHVGGGSLPQGNPRKIYLNFRNNLLLLHKNLPARVRWLHLLVRLFLDGIAGLRSLVQGRPKEVGAILRAHLDYYRWWMGGTAFFYPPCKKRSFRKLKGTYRGSLAWQYFIRQRKTFGEVMRSKV